MRKPVEPYTPPPCPDDRYMVYCNDPGGGVGPAIALLLFGIVLLHLAGRL